MTHEQKIDCINALQKFAQTFVDVASGFRSEQSNPRPLSEMC